MRGAGVGIGRFLPAAANILSATNDGEIEMTQFRPKYISFDCYGTLTNFQMAPMARKLFADRIRPEQMETFVADFAAYRLDEVLGAWKPYREVVRNSVERTCRKWKLQYRDQEAVQIYE